MIANSNQKKQEDELKAFKAQLNRFVSSCDCLYSIHSSVQYQVVIMVNCFILSSEMCEKQEVERKMNDELER